MKKKIIALAKRRELYFVILVYPALFFSVKKVGTIIKPWINQNFNYYGTLSLMISGVVLILVFLEISMKIYGYGIQGDRLSLREKEGVHIGEVNNGKRN